MSKCRAIVDKIMVMAEMDALGKTLQERFGITNISAKREEMEAQVAEFLGMAKPDEVKDIQELHIDVSGISDKAYKILEVSEDDWLVVDAQPEEAEECVLTLSGEELEEALAKSASLRESTKKATDTILATKPTLGE